VEPSKVNIFNLAKTTRTVLIEPAASQSTEATSTAQWAERAWCISRVGSLAGDGRPNILNSPITADISRDHRFWLSRLSTVFVLWNRRLAVASSRSESWKSQDSITAPRYWRRDSAKAVRHTQQKSLKADFSVSPEYNTRHNEGKDRQSRRGSRETRRGETRQV